MSRNPLQADTASYFDRCRRLLLALCATGLFTVVEAVGGWLAGSLAVLADAAHMLTHRRNSDAALIKIKTVLRDKFRISHSTIQIETEGCADHQSSEDR